MHRDDRLHTLHVHRGECRGVESVMTRFDVAEDGRRPEAGDRARRGEERERRRDDAIAGSDAQRHQPREERIRAARHADHVVSVHHLRARRFERLDFLAEDELPMIEHAQRGGLHGFGEGGRHAAEVDEWNVHDDDSVSPPVGAG